MLASGIRGYLDRRRIGCAAPRFRHIGVSMFAETDALRYLQAFLHDEKLANSEQPTQLFSI